MSTSTGTSRPYRRRTRRDGEFPSFKMDEMVHYASWIERDLYFLLEFDPAVAAYQAQPFEIEATFDDGSHHTYTPDARAAVYKGRGRVYECKGDDYVDTPATLQQRSIGSAWCAENEHDFVLVTGAGLQADHRLANVQLIWPYR